QRSDVYPVLAHAGEIAAYGTIAIEYRAIALAVACGGRTDARHKSGGRRIVRHGGPPARVRRVACRDGAALDLRARGFGDRTRRDEHYAQPLHGASTTTARWCSAARSRASRSGVSPCGKRLINRRRLRSAGDGGPVATDNVIIGVVSVDVCAYGM